ncbi:dethiobiotin synthetase [Persephonella hydrogeniphila]|uniref:ATP-dependent dethiobiotin synthetase BioD n=1 Tax=Persephonella hydrogeniphila TaxID=198703 RepID=A0A285NJ83_9AQUI|nr:dethiobiotin synthase [Persephonella hydrogeniphila]SNZ09027.1 dethiobiotin synthetase [Persephonella hydrogeniphila]
MSKAIFVTATDTGVGKTTVSAAITYILKKRGYSVGYYKPVETGCTPDCQDASLLSKMTGQSIDEIVLYRFNTPVAPFVAQEIEHKYIQMERIYSHLDYLKGKYECLIVEGAGGIKVPITEEEGRIVTYLDFVYESSLPVLLVSRAGLGTINHTTLTVDALNHVNADIKGIVFNGYSGEDISEHRNPEIVHLMTGIDILAVCNKSENPINECIYRIEPVIDYIF